MQERYDVIIIGSGPNGLSAGVVLAREGLRVLIVERASTVGGGTRTVNGMTMPGFRHDVCAAVHPMGALSPFFRSLGLEKFGLEWVYPGISVAHPMDDGPAVVLTRSLEETADGLGVDAQRYSRLMRPFVERIDDLLEDALAPLRIPRHPFLLARFGMHGLQPAWGFAHRHFREQRARALFAGCAAHAILPFSKYFTTAMGLVFLASGHAVDWPVAKGGSQAIAVALLNAFRSHGGELQLGMHVNDLADLPHARAYLFDTDPLQLARIAGDRLPFGYQRRLAQFQFGPGVFKIDLALNAPIPWSDPRCASASTVHVGGTIAEVARSELDAWEGRVSARPFVLVAQQSLFDRTRAPEGHHTAWAYCHVPAGSTVDMSAVIIDRIERSAPGFRETILASHAMNTTQFHDHNPNYVGGAVTGGAAHLAQLFTRPVARFDPYTTPNHRLFICSASTPPGGGVHGMCGFHAARSVLQRWKSLR